MHRFRYLVLNIHGHHECHTDLLNRVFEIWDQTFTSVAHVGQTQLNHDDFFRSHKVGVLLFEDEIVGFNLFTFFDLSLTATHKHRYFRDLGECAPGRLKSENIHKVLTMEYFTISPPWRKQLKEAPWTEILAGLGLKFLDSSHADAVLGTPRIDIGVHEMCYRLGAYDFQEPVERMNIPCAVVLFPKGEPRQFQHPLTRRWVRGLPIAEGLDPQPPVVPPKMEALSSSSDPSASFLQLDPELL